jgi:hypothetical protein
MRSAHGSSSDTPQEQLGARHKAWQGHPGCDTCHSLAGVSTDALTLQVFGQEE